MKCPWERCELSLHKGAAWYARRLYQGLGFFQKKRTSKDRWSRVQLSVWLWLTPLIWFAYGSVSNTFHQRGYIRIEFPRAFNGFCLSGQNIAGALRIWASHRIITFGALFDEESLHCHNLSLFEVG